MEAFKYSENDLAIKNVLDAYLPKIPLNSNLEDDISKLKVCLRCYLKLHLLQEKTDILRVNLMFIICQLVQRVYCRHIDESDHLFSFKAYTRYGYALTGITWPSYFVTVQEIKDCTENEEDANTILRDYYEIETLMKQHLPPIDDEALRLYLNYLVRDVLRVFCIDNYTLYEHVAKDFWGNRIFTDERDYSNMYKKMKMLTYRSILIPNVVSDKEIDNFFAYYSLK